MAQIDTFERAQLAMHGSDPAGVVPTFKERSNIVHHFENIEAAPTKSRRPCY
jgi:hypothetical protein